MSSTLVALRPTNSLSQRLCHDHGLWPPLWRDLTAIITASALDRTKDPLKLQSRIQPMPGVSAQTTLQFLPTCRCSPVQRNLLNFVCCLWLLSVGGAVQRKVCCHYAVIMGRRSHIAFESSSPFPCHTHSGDLPHSSLLWKNSSKPNSFTKIQDLLPKFT